MYVRRQTRSSWKALGVFILTLAAIVIGAVTLENGNPTREPLPTAVQNGTADVRAYFPSSVGFTQRFVGYGAEYASFTRTVSAVDGDLVLVQDQTTGTTVGAVYSRSPQRVALLASVEEYSPETNLLAAVDRSASPKRIPLQAPIAVGNRWDDGSEVREIVQIIPEMSVPAGTFYDVVVVRSQPKYSTESEMTEYYALNIGLIRRDYVSNGGGQSQTVSTNLDSFGIKLPEAKVVEEPATELEVE